jgi:hypothetical protein
LKKKLTENDLRRIVYYQKLENDAKAAKEQKDYVKAIDLLTEATNGWKDIIAKKADAPDEPFNVDKTNPDVDFQTDDLTREILKNYFGIDIRDNK